MIWRFALLVAALLIASPLGASRRRLLLIGNPIYVNF